MLKNVWVAVYLACNHKCSITFYNKAYSDCKYPVFAILQLQDILIIFFHINSYSKGIYIRRSLKNIYRGQGIGGRVLGQTSEGLLAQKSPICFSIHVLFLLDQILQNFVRNSIIILRTATSYFQFVFITVILFHLRTGYLVGCRILASEILVAFICITQFLSTKLVARMNDINQFLEQNIVLPKQLHYISFFKKRT